MWQLKPDIRLIFHRWPDESAVYECVSGDTHLLNSMAFTVLNALVDGSVSEAQLSEVINNAVQDASRDEVARGLENILQNLQLLGLVEQQP